MHPASTLVVQEIKIPVDENPKDAQRKTLPLLLSALLEWAASVTFVDIQNDRWSATLWSCDTGQNLQRWIQRWLMPNGRGLAFQKAASIGFLIRNTLCR